MPRLKSSAIEFAVVGAVFAAVVGLILWFAASQGSAPPGVDVVVIDIRQDRTADVQHLVANASAFYRSLGVTLHDARYIADPDPVLSTQLVSIAEAPNPCRGQWTKAAAIRDLSVSIDRRPKTVVVLVGGTIRSSLIARERFGWTCASAPWCSGELRNDSGFAAREPNELLAVILVNGDDVVTASGAAVVAHEFGHVFGLSHPNDVTSCLCSSAGDDAVPNLMDSDAVGDSASLHDLMLNEDQVACIKVHLAHGGVV